MQLIELAGFDWIYYFTAANQKCTNSVSVDHVQQFKETAAPGGGGCFQQLMISVPVQLTNAALLRPALVADYSPVEGSLIFGVSISH